MDVNKDKNPYLEEFVPAEVEEVCSGDTCTARVTNRTLTALQGSLSTVTLMDKSCPRTQ